MQPRHVGAGAKLIEENELIQLYVQELTEPFHPRFFHVGTLPFADADRFLRPSPSRRTPNSRHPNCPATLIEEPHWSYASATAIG